MTAEARTRSFWDAPAAGIDGPWREKRRLASALRDLVALCVTSQAPETALAYAADAVTRVVERLRHHPQRTFKEALGSLQSHEDFARFADRSTMMGWSNPFAPPMELDLEGEVAVANVTFGAPFEGIPGHVHGGIVAAAFDQLFGFLQVKRGVGALTGELTVRYRKPTPLLVPLRLEAKLRETEGRRSKVDARCLAGDVVTAEAEGIFIAVDPQRLHGFIQRSEG